MFYKVEKINNRLYITGPDTVWADGTKSPFCVPCKTIIEGEAKAARLDRALIEAAEDDNARVDIARHYIAIRRARDAKPQFELF